MPIYLDDFYKNILIKQNRVSEGGSFIQGHWHSGVMLFKLKEIRNKRF